MTKVFIKPTNYYFLKLQKQAESEKTDMATIVQRILHNYESMPESYKQRINANVETGISKLYCRIDDNILKKIEQQAIDMGKQPEKLLTAIVYDYVIERAKYIKED